MSGKPAAVTKLRLADRLVDELRKLIAAGTYPIGTRLPREAQLSEMFAVGRSTVREAVRVLSHTGEIDVRHGEGTFVRTGAPPEALEARLRRAKIAELYEARRVFEVEIAGLAAERRTVRDVAAMRKELRVRARARAAGDPDTFLEADFAFHVAVAKATKNHALYDVYVAFADVIRESLRGTMAADGVRRDADRFHDELCDAIEAGERQTAMRIAREHLAASLQQLTSP